MTYSSRVRQVKTYNKTLLDYFMNLASIIHESVGFSCFSFQSVLDRGVFVTNIQIVNLIIYKVTITKELAIVKYS